MPKADQDMTIFYFTALLFTFYDLWRRIHDLLETSPDE